MLLCLVTHRVDHRDRVVAFRPVQHAELVVGVVLLVSVAALASRILRVALIVLVVIAEDRDAFFLIRGPGPVYLVFLVCLAEEVLQVDLLAAELDSVVRFAFVHISQLAHVHLDRFVRTHLRHPVREVVEVVLWREAHVPLLVDVHNLVQVARFVALAAELELALLPAADDGLDVEQV